MPLRVRQPALPNLTTSYAALLISRQWERHPPLPQQVDWSSRQAAGLVLCWPLDQRGLRDISNSFLHGTGSPTSTLTPYGVGKSFNGSVDVRATPNSQIVNATEWSCSAFVRFTSFPNAYNTVLSAVGTASVGFRDLHVKSNGKLAVYVDTTGTSSSYDGTGVHTLSANVWYHVAFSYSNATGLIGYVNGVVDGTAAATGSVQALGGTPYITVANNPPDNPTRFVNGSIVDARFYNRELTAAEIRDIYRNPGGLFKPIRGIPVSFEAGGAAAQTLTPSLYTNNQTFYSPTVTPGAVTLSPSLYTNQQTFYGPTLTATVTVNPSLYINNQTFYGPTATPGTVTLQPALYTNTQSFYTPSVNQTGAVVYPSLFTNTNIFFAAEAINEYPDPSQVEFGVKYGPGGTLVGTLTGGGGSSIIRLRSFTERH